MQLRFGKQGRKVKSLLLEHLDLVADTVDAMAHGVDAFLQGRSWEELEELAIHTHRQESSADDARRKAEMELVQGALLAGTRRTLLNIAEGVDRLANSAEGTMYYLVLQRVPVPELLHPLVREIVEVTQAQMGDLKAAVRGLLEGSEDTVRCAEAVDHKEGRVDELQRRAVKRLFATEGDLAEKILVRGFVDQLVKISDRAEDLSDQIVMAVALRRP
ncbi:MAG: DUF47 domain-containing protein [Candidatus Bipolaricaulaceae bacterium]